MSGCRWVTTPSWLSQSLRPFLHSYCCYCSVSRVQLFVTAWTAAWQASLSFTISCSLLKLMSIESVMPCNQHVLCRPLLLLPSIFHSTRVFSNELALHIRWPNYWIFGISCGFVVSDLYYTEIHHLCTRFDESFFLSQIDIKFCQMLFLHLLRWSCNFYPSFCYCGVSLWLVCECWTIFMTLE